MTENSMDQFLSLKKQYKKDFLKELGLKEAKPLVAIVLDHELSAKENALLQKIFEAVSHIKANFVLVCDHHDTLKATKNVIPLSYSQANRKKTLEASDMAIVFPFNDVQEMLLHGTIPITSLRPEVADYNPNRETGNSFIFTDQNQWAIFAALVRAVETFKFPYDWNHIVRQGLKSVSI